MAICFQHTLTLEPSFLELIRQVAEIVVKLRTSRDAVDLLSL